MENETTKDTTDTKDATETRTETPERELIPEGERIFSRIWKLLALRGVVSVAFGFVLVIWPDIGLSAMTTIVAIMAIATGILSGAAAFSLPSGAASQHRVWLGITSIVGIAVGIAVLVWPDISSKALLYVIAMWAIATGVTEFFTALVVPMSGGQTALVAVGGIVMAAFGVVMFIEPSTGAVALLALVAAFAIVRGTFDIALAVELRRVAGEVKDRFRSRVQPTPVTHG